eukprot:TRINITY_DN6643_c0_g1_i3.p1 TRINITY_DN6643_c0_g1~~TRINITY_DN6643_c0_g1_i3.p1  ORF type:complete len:337 (+),score=53.36 TRINITY_DN6643_c0_g1_i3:48-1013(+)
MESSLQSVKTGLVTLAGCREVYLVAAGCGLASAAALWALWLPRGSPLIAGGMVKPLLVGHRGCRLAAGPPENTLEAFRHALDRGADAIELDCRLTKDEVVVVFHDCSVGRVMKCDGKRGEADATARPPQIQDLTLAELQEMEFKDDSAACRVPTLEDAVLLVKSRGKQILIETKDIHKPVTCADRVVTMLRKHDAFDFSTIISFDPRSIYSMRSKEARVKTCLLWTSGLLQGWHSHGTERLAWWMKLFLGLIDFALICTARSAWLPHFLGASAIGPRFQSTSPEELQSYGDGRVAHGSAQPERRCQKPLSERFAKCFLFVR